MNCVTGHVSLEAWKPSVQVKKGGGGLWRGFQKRPANRQSFDSFFIWYFVLNSSIEWASSFNTIEKNWKLFFLFYFGRL